MDKVEIRRVRLRQWFERRSLPEKEKSYLSQLMTGKASFGERAARRLEADYAMGDGYLDVPPEEYERTLDDFLNGPGAGYVSAQELSELITLYAQCTTEHRKNLISTARSAAKLSADSRDIAANDQTKPG